MEKLALCAFKGESMCFMHVLLNALDLHDKGNEVKVIITGAACRLIPDMVKEDGPSFESVRKPIPWTSSRTFAEPAPTKWDLLARQKNTRSDCWMT